MRPLADARSIFALEFDWPTLARTGHVATADALGRITSEPVFARLSSPGYHGAAMDGYAVRAEATFGAFEERPLRLRLGRDAHPVNTGHPLPEGTDAVIMIEHVQRVGADQIEIASAAFPWQHVRRVGEDVVEGELVVPHGHRLAAVDLAALLTAGVFRVAVVARPRVAILPTGSELVEWRDAEREPPRPGAIVDSNSVLLAGLVREAGGEPVMLDRQADDLEGLRVAIDAAVDRDVAIVLVNAGASAGSEDFTSHAVAALGEVLVHGVQAMPGKPTLLGRIRGKPVVGTPGYPVSAWVSFDQFVRPAIERLGGVPESARERLTATAGRRLASRLGVEEFVRVHLGRVADRVIALPLKRGAGTITSMTQADGLLRIAAESDGCEEGAPVEVELLRPRSAVDGTLVMVGSHDVTIDLVADRLPWIAPHLRLSASNVGSFAGLLALRDGRSHLGGTHLLDPETGEYNIAAVQRALPGTPVRLVTLAHREQGLMVRRGNPKGVRGLADLARDDVTFVNRQPGSGTRVLLDYLLQKLAIAAKDVRGYDVEEYTHMAVAAQVAAGQADAGLGILAAARALGLDFVPAATERYDLCIAEAFASDPRVMAVLEILQQVDFREAVRALGGYHVEEMGRVQFPS